MDAIMLSVLSPRMGSQDRILSIEGGLGYPAEIIKEAAQNIVLPDNHDTFNFGEQYKHTCSPLAYSDGADVSYARAAFPANWNINLHEFKSKPLNCFNSKRKYQGEVRELTNDGFIGRLRNLSESAPDQEAEFYFEDVSPNDKELVAIGALFYWNIGYMTLVGGQRLGCHTLAFKRLPVWTKTEIKAAKQRAKSLFEWVNAH
jgi:hypothetical protein